MKTIAYADLTWPDVAALPRDLPLLIPLGEEEYDLQRVARRLKAEAVVTLPAIPYGFPRSGSLGDLAVGAGLMRRLAPRGLHFLQTAIRADNSGGRSWRWPADLVERVVVISIGHTEQHGLHLPLDTDTCIVAAIAAGVEGAAPGRGT